MSPLAHGEFRIQWCESVCVLTLLGGYNREGAQRMAEAVKASWLAAGSPSRWAHVVDLRPWEGGTPDSFGPARELVAWTMEHGVCAVIRLRQTDFITRIIDRQSTLEDARVPVLDFTDPEVAWQWLQSQGVACASCREVLGVG